MLELVQTGNSDFVPEFGECGRHGAWQRNMRVDGVVRWLPACPRCVQDEASHRFLERASIPLRFQDKRLDTFIAEQPGQISARNIAAEYAGDFKSAMRAGRCLLFVGNPGTGKTHIAIAIAHKVIDAGFSALYVTALDLVSKIRDTWSTPDRSESGLLRSLASVDLLVIDEVGGGYGKGAEQVELFKVINRRYENLRPMILLSNCNIDGLKESLGERSFDRLREGGGRAVIFDWQSHRGSI